MKEKIFKTNELYFLLVEEYICGIPDDMNIIRIDTGLKKTYCTIAKSKDGKSFKDIFELKKYKHERYLFGVFQELKIVEPLQNFLGDLPEYVERKDLLQRLKNHLEINKEIYPAIFSNKDISLIKKIKS